MTTSIKINQNDGFTPNAMTGGETTVDFDFPIFDADHISILETDTDGDITVLVKDTDFTVPAGSVNQQAGGTVNLTAASYPSGATNGHTFTALLAVPEERTTDFIVAGDFLAEVLNKELDLITQISQQLRRDVDKAAKLPDDQTGTVTLPTPEDEKAIVWDGTSGLMKNGPTVDEIANAQTYANNASASATTATTQATTATTKASEASDSADDAEEWAIRAEDDPVPVANGGNGTDTYSAFHWAQKAQDFASGAANAISYDNSASGLTATDVQAALDEIDGTLDGLGALATLDTVGEDEIDINGVTSGTVDGADEVLFSDTSASNVVRKTTAQDIADLASGSGGLIDYQVFTSSGTWTKPAGCNAVKVTVVGGGGGGGGPSTAGGTGGTSSFGSFCSASGGSGGSMASGDGAGGAGGIGSNGDLNLRGNIGSNGVNDANVAGNGAGSFLGGGGLGGTNGNSVPSASGFGSGSGGFAHNSSAGAGGGGGSGGAAIEHITSGLGSTVSVTVGSGGSAASGGGGAKPGIAGVVIVEAYT